ncbi:hypothetical protein [Enterocloster bolteae]|uniref:hypothetical protein n=1 Tax=Enterocloster bolteae TaxID=208479 RepID=UPI00189F26DA|nr:hypothetical protein [Enterocloster bolteae]
MANEHAIQATGTFVVSKGFRLLTKLAASQGSLQFTRAAVGTGKPPEGYSPESMIGLNAYKIDAEIADYGVQDDMAYITVQVSSDNVTEGFLVTEVGVFAEDPDEGEILYGYMDISTDPTYIYANGSTNRSKFAEFTLYVLVGSVSNVIAAVTPGSIITRDTFTAANLKAIDTHGILGGEAGAETTGQGLIDALTNKLLTEFVTNTVLMERLGTYVLKSKIVNDFLSTDEETVLSGPMGKLLKEQLNVLNTKIGAKVAVVSFEKSSIPIAAGADFYAYIPIDIDTTDVIWAFPVLTDAPGDNCTKVNISTCVWQDKSKRIYVNGCNLASGTANISLAGVLIAIR